MPKTGRAASENPFAVDYPPTSVEFKGDDGFEERRAFYASRAVFWSKAACFFAGMTVGGMLSAMALLILALIYGA